MELIQHYKFNDFLIKNEKELRELYFEQYHLDCILNDIYNKLEKFNVGFNLFDTQTNIRVLFAKTNEWYIYGEKWNQNSINVLVDILKHFDLEIYILKGNREIILNLARALNSKYIENNYRIIFKHSLTSLPKINEYPHIELGSLNDIDEIQKMHLDYYKEDFPTSQTTAEELKQVVFEYITNKNLYIWRNDLGLITSKIEIINNEPSKIFFGGMFTKEEFRGQGYATKLLSNLTNYFVNHTRKECGLLTENSNSKAQNVFRKSGYKEIYHWTLGICKKNSR